MENCVWNYDYVRLAWDSGFCFDNSKVRSSLDWSSIGLVDVDKVVSDRDIAVIEKYLPIILQFALSEELTKVLEPNFVKIFKLSQLSVQYLLFCKKYLDNTVFLLKKELAKCREEQNKWSIKENEYKEHISTLKRKNKEFKALLDACPENAFNCPECCKVFSTQEYLDAHIKRRHEVNALIQNETDKLQLEIKQLKEQLNSTEKFGRIETVQNNDHSHKSNESSRLEQNSRVKDLQDKFDKLKSHVETELKYVNDQKFYLEKCEKWMEMAFLKLGSQKDKDYPEQRCNIKIATEPNPVIKSTSSTQTAYDDSKNKEFEVDQIMYEVERQKSNVELHLKEIFKLQEHIKQETRNQIGQFEEVVQEKVSTSLQKLENQMSLFWEKLSEIQMQATATSQHDLPQKKPDDKVYIAFDSNAFIDSKPSKVSKPKPKPRKPSLDRYLNFEKNEQTTEKKKPAEVKAIQMSETTTDDSSIISKSDNEQYTKEDVRVPSTSAKQVLITPTKYSPIKEKPIVNVTNRGVMKDKPIVNVTNKGVMKEDELSYDSVKETKEDTNLQKDLRKDLENVLFQRLKDIGVSNKWKGMPDNSFQKAIKIVRHQSSMICKSYPEYANIRGKIVKDVESQIARVRKGHHSKKDKGKPIQKSQSSENTMKPTVSKSTLSMNAVLQKAKPLPEMVNIDKPPHQVKTMYASSSDDLSASFGDDENVVKINESKKQFISELKETVRLRKNTSSSEELEIPSVIQSKGLLKTSSTSVNSLSKKKVLFDLESMSTTTDKSNNNNNNKEQIKPNNNIPIIQDYEEVENERDFPTSFIQNKPSTLSITPSISQVNVKNYSKFNEGQKLETIHSDEMLEVEEEFEKEKQDEIKQDVDFSKVQTNFLSKNFKSDFNSEATSIGSSVLELDATKPQPAPRNKITVPSNKEEDTSDWDISDIMTN